MLVGKQRRGNQYPLWHKDTDTDRGCLGTMAAHSSWSRYFLILFLAPRLHVAEMIHQKTIANLSCYFLKVSYVHIFLVCLKYFFLK